MDEGKGEEEEEKKAGGGGEMKEVRGIRTRTDLQLECNGVPGAHVQPQSLYLIFFFFLPRSAPAILLILLRSIMCVHLLIYNSLSPHLSLRTTFTCLPLLPPHH